MKIVKFLLIAIVIAAVCFVAAVFIMYKSQASVAELDVSQAQSREAKVALIDEWLQQAEADDKFNGIVLMIRGGDVLLEKGYGYTDYTMRTPLTAHSSMRLASISKQFTAAAIMILHDRGEIDFDDTVSTYILDFPYEGVTIRHLLNQTSGVPDNYMSLGEKFKNDYEFLTISKAVELVTADKAPAEAAPGARYAYSNTNYILLAHIAEIVSQQPFEDFMQDTLFTPLGMKDSRVWNLASKDTTFDGKTEGFDYIERSDAAPVKLTVLDGVSGDGGIFSSAHDFKIWAKFWQGNSLMSQDTLAEAFKTPTLADGMRSNYGFGWVITENGRFHNGEWLATQSMFIQNPKNGSVLLVIDNASRFSFDNVVKTLTTALRAIEP